MGSLSRVTIESKALKNNMLGDPSVRVVEVYISAAHDGQGLPFLVNLVGFTSSGPSQTNWVGFREYAPERLDRLIGSSACRRSSSPFPIASPGSAAINRIPPRTPSAYSSTHFNGNFSHSRPVSLSQVAQPDGR
jgi:hypothetical protein